MYQPPAAADGRWLVAGLRFLTARRPGSVLRPHRFRPDEGLPPDHRGDRWCVCGLPEPSRWHDLPNDPPSDVDARTTELDRRISGTEGEA